MSGDAISFCCVDEVKYLGAIESLTGKRIPTLESPWPMEVFTPTEPQPRGPRPSKLNRQGQPLEARPGRAQSAGAKPQSVPRHLGGSARSPRKAQSAPRRGNWEVRSASGQSRNPARSHGTREVSPAGGGRRAGEAQRPYDRDGARRGPDGRARRWDGAR